LTKHEVEKILDASIKRDANRACLVGLSLVNEGWGVDFSKGDVRGWIKALFRRAKEHFQGFVVDNSPCMVGHIITDVEDYHKYYGMPQHAEEFISWVDEFGKEPGWLYCDCEETERAESKPRVLSEFGVWGLPTLEHLKRCYDGTPPFFKTQNPPLRPEGVEERFARSPLAKVYNGNFDKFARATQVVQGEGIKFMIERLRLQERLSGYVLTELTDIDWEANGVFSFARDRKYAAGILSFCQGQDLIVLTLARNVFCTGEKVEGDVYLVHFSQCDYEGGVVKWWVDGMGVGGEVEVKNTPQGSVRKIGKLSFVVPELEEPGWFCMRLALYWWGEERVSNFYRLLFVPKGLVEGMPQVYFGNTEDGERGKLERAGIGIAPPDEAELAVVYKNLDEGAGAIIEKGGTCIVCQPEWVEVAELKGDWCSAFFWALPQLFHPLPVGGVLSFEAKNLITNKVIKDKGEILAGAFRGWMYEEGGCLVKADERLYLTTFNLIDALCRKDALAKVLLINLVRA